MSSSSLLLVLFSGCGKWDAQFSGSTVDAHYCRHLSNSSESIQSDCVILLHPAQRSKQTPQLAGHSSQPRPSHQTNFFRSTFVSSIYCSMSTVKIELLFGSEKKSCESSLCIAQPQKYKQILLLSEFGEEAVSRFAESQSFTEGQQNVNFCCSCWVQRAIFWFISWIFAFWLCSRQPELEAAI